MKTGPFSLNIDEVTGNNLHEVMYILVSRYSLTSKNVIVKHLASASLIKVVSETVFNATEMGLYCKYCILHEALGEDWYIS